MVELCIKYTLIHFFIQSYRKGASESCQGQPRDNLESERCSPLESTDRENSVFEECSLS